ncbi:MAG: hypothetical protein ACRYGG_12255, partial [Janthinobacterium lividum]
VVTNVSRERIQIAISSFKHQELPIIQEVSSALINLISNHSIKGLSEDFRYYLGQMKLDVNYNQVISKLFVKFNIESIVHSHMKHSYPVYSTHWPAIPITPKQRGDEPRGEDQRSRTSLADEPSNSRESNQYPGRLRTEDRSVSSNKRAPPDHERASSYVKVGTTLAPEPASQSSNKRNTDAMLKMESISQSRDMNQVKGSHQRSASTMLRQTTLPQGHSISGHTFTHESPSSNSNRSPHEELSSNKSHEEYEDQPVYKHGSQTPRSMNPLAKSSALLNATGVNIPTSGRCSTQPSGQYNSDNEEEDCFTYDPKNPYYGGVSTYDNRKDVLFLGKIVTRLENDEQFSNQYPKDLAAIVRCVYYSTKK